MEGHSKHAIFHRPGVGFVRKMGPRLEGHDVGALNKYVVCTPGLGQKYADLARFLAGYEMAYFGEGCTDSRYCIWVLLQKLAVPAETHMVRGFLRCPSPSPLSTSNTLAFLLQKMSLDRN